MSSSLIDNIVLDNPSSAVDSRILNFAISDHLLCYATFSWKPAPHPKHHTTYAKSLKGLNRSTFFDNLQSLPWSIMDIFDDPSDKLDVFNQLLNDVVRMWDMSM